MPRPLRFGALLIPNVAWDELLRRCCTLEELGVDTVWIDDHLANPTRPGQPWFDSWTAIAAFAQATSRVSIGPLVANTVLRHPAMLARQALTADHVSGGRVVVGIGSGYAETDHWFVDVPQWSPAERSARFAESVALIDHLLRGDTAPGGEHFAATDLTLAPASTQQPRPPLYIAAHGAVALDVAARHGDAWVSFGGWGLTSAELVAVTARRNQRLDELCAQHGRDPSTVRRVVLAGSAAVTPDPMWTSVDAFEDFVGRCREAGMDELAVYYPPQSVSRAVEPGVFEQVLADVVPRLRCG